MKATLTIILLLITLTLSSQTFYSDFGYCITNKNDTIILSDQISMELGIMYIDHSILGRLHYDVVDDLFGNFYLYNAENGTKISIFKGFDIIMIETKTTKFVYLINEIVSDNQRFVK